LRGLTTSNSITIAANNNQVIKANGNLTFVLLTNDEGKEIFSEPVFDRVNEVFIAKSNRDHYSSFYNYIVKEEEADPKLLQKDNKKQILDLLSNKDLVGPVSLRGLKRLVLGIKEYNDRSISFKKKFYKSLEGNILKKNRIKNKSIGSIESFYDNIAFR